MLRIARSPVENRALASTHGQREKEGEEGLSACGENRILCVVIIGLDEARSHTFRQRRRALLRHQHRLLKVGDAQQRRLAIDCSFWRYPGSATRTQGVRFIFRPIDISCMKGKSEHLNESWRREGRGALGRRNGTSRTRTSQQRLHSMQPWTQRAVKVSCEGEFRRHLPRLKYPIVRLGGMNGTMMSRPLLLRDGTAEVPCDLCIVTIGFEEEPAHTDRQSASHHAALVGISEGKSPPGTTWR
jgi:hypothetical protein